MIISHKYKFIFIKTYKTAGTSLEVFLSQCCGPQDTVTPIYPHVEPHEARNYSGRWLPFREILATRGHRVRRLARQWMHAERFYNHIPAIMAKERMPAHVWNNYYKFSIDRNPWDKVLSMYHMTCDRKGCALSIDQFLKEEKLPLNYPLYCDRSGNCMVDRVIKYEHLYEELGEVFAKLGVPYDGKLGVRAKSEHRKERQGYQEVLNPQQRDQIATLFTKEIEMHGYVY